MPRGEHFRESRPYITSKHIFFGSLEPPAKFLYLFSPSDFQKEIQIEQQKINMTTSTKKMMQLNFFDAACAGRANAIGQWK
jgi:hypothetical protein